MPFFPHGPTASLAISATNASQNMDLGLNGSHVHIHNTHASQKLWVAFGQTNAQTVVTPTGGTPGGYLIAPGKDMVIPRSGIGGRYMAFISDAAGPTVVGYVAVGSWQG
jgi:hypothetical protein